MFNSALRKTVEERLPALNLNITSNIKAHKALIIDIRDKVRQKKPNRILSMFKRAKRIITFHLPRIAAVAIMLFGMAINTYADVAAGNGKLKDAAGQIEQYQTGVSALMKAIAAAIAVVGAFSVYFKMQNGDQDVKKTIMLVVGGCIAFLVMSEALPKMLA